MIFRRLLARIGMANEVVYRGWIKGNQDDKAKLRLLGIRGKMIYREDRNVIEYCEATEEMLERLVLRYSHIRLNTFTGIDIVTGKQLPPRQQKFWKR